MNQDQTAAQALAGKRVVAVVESRQFIPQELDIYQQRFQS